jgi:DNA repair photolyase
MIISASRRTDIPAFYSEWFMNRIKAGYVLVKNPFNKALVSKIPLNPELVDCIVFWSKNPENIIKYLPDLKEYNYYFQITLNSYDKSIEPDVPLKRDIIKTVIKLSDLIGKEKVIWRYDPIFYTEKFNYSYHVKYFEKIASSLKGKTEKCIISFMDLYKKCERNMRNINFHILDLEEVHKIAEGIVGVGKKHGIKIETCAEEFELEKFGIHHAQCIDGELISRIAGKTIKVSKDKNQRANCRCAESIDIGTYNTCPHNCIYCYANLNKKLVSENYKNYDPDSEFLDGELVPGAKVSGRKVKSCFIGDKNQMKFSQLVDK